MRSIRIGVRGLLVLFSLSLSLFFFRVVVIVEGGITEGESKGKKKLILCSVLVNMWNHTSFPAYKSKIWDMSRPAAGWSSGATGREGEKRKGYVILFPCSYRGFLFFFFFFIFRLVPANGTPGLNKEDSIGVVCWQAMPGFTDVYVFRYFHVLKEMRCECSFMLYVLFGIDIPSTLNPTSITSSILVSRVTSAGRNNPHPDSTGKTAPASAPSYSRTSAAFSTAPAHRVASFSKTRARMSWPTAPGCSTFSDPTVLAGSAGSRCVCRLSRGHTWCPHRG